MGLRHNTHFTSIHPPSPPSRPSLPPPSSPATLPRSPSGEIRGQVVFTNALFRADSFFATLGPVAGYPQMTNGSCQAFVAFDNSYAVMQCGMMGTWRRSGGVGGRGLGG